MDFITLLVTAVGLSMDAFSVALCKGLTVKKAQVKQGLIVGLYFGFFQAFMPLIGYFFGARFYQTIQAWDHWIAFILLAILGLNMIREADSPKDLSGGFSFKEMLPLAIATSIDALIIGVSLAVLKVNIYQSASFIGLCTFLLSFVGFYLGHYFGQKWEKWAQVLGGDSLDFNRKQGFIGTFGLFALSTSEDVLIFLPFYLEKGYNKRR